MKKTFNVDQALLGEAQLACGALTETETIRLGLKALIRQAANRQLRDLLGSEKTVADVPRRREVAVTRRKAA